MATETWKEGICTMMEAEGFRNYTVVSTALGGFIVYADNEFPQFHITELDMMEGQGKFIDLIKGRIEWLKAEIDKNTSSKESTDSGSAETQSASSK